MKVSVREPCALLYSLSNSTHHGLVSNKEWQKIPQKISSFVRSSNEFFLSYSVSEQLNRMSLSVDLQELVDHKSFCGLDNLFSCSILPAELAWSWVGISMSKINGSKYLSLDETFQEWWGKNKSYKLHLFLFFFL